MKIKLIFHDWVKNGESVYDTEDGIELSLSDFHSGTVFYREIRLDKEHQLLFFEATKKRLLSCILYITGEAPRIFITNKGFSLILSNNYL